MLRFACNRTHSIVGWFFALLVAIHTFALPPPHMELEKAQALLQSLRDHGIVFDAAVAAQPGLTISRYVPENSVLMRAPLTEVLTPASKSLLDVVTTARLISEQDLRLVLRFLSEWHQKQRSRWWYWFQTFPPLDSVEHVGSLHPKLHEIIRLLVPEIEHFYLAARSIAYHPRSVDKFGGVSMSSMDVDALVLLAGRCIVRRPRPWLVPGLELLARCWDHAESNVALRFSSQFKEVHVVASRDLHAGDQLRLSSDRRANLDLLLRDGYSLPGNPLGISIELATTEQKGDLLECEKRDFRVQLDSREVEQLAHIATNVHDSTDGQLASRLDKVGHWGRLFRCHQQSLLGMLRPLMGTLDKVESALNLIEQADSHGIRSNAMPTFLLDTAKQEVQRLQHLHRRLLELHLKGEAGVQTSVEVAWKAFVEDNQLLAAARSFQAFWVSP